jgi:2-polyprenyl-3-methyl-5-hydroxy-6-metoxy-1,4-benzoquinol methylase
MKGATKDRPAEPAKLDQAKLDAFVGKVVGEMGAMFGGGLMVLGDRLGLYRAMADGKPVTSAALAERTGTNERYVREWLMAQASGGYVEYDASAKTFRLPPEHAFALTDEFGALFFPGAFQVALGALKAIPKLEQRFRSGDGLDWGEQDRDVFEGTERFFRPNYIAHLLGEWLPALDGVQAKLEKGARVADVGCGRGASTILLAKAFPKSTFVGFDYHEPSIEGAREAATRAGVKGNVRFERAKATDFPGEGYDLVAFFDCLHDMGDPVAVAKHVRGRMAKDGTWMVVEPFAGDRPEQNLNPVGRVFYSASTLLCCPASMAQDGRAAFGAQAGEARLSDAIRKGGFSRVRRAAETPFNIVLEARP